MTIYAVGDIQGCLSPLKKLLEKVSFNPSYDQLWSTGDIVNRGPESLGTMRFLKSLGDAFRMVLGNHDLHLLAIARGCRKATVKDSLDDIVLCNDVEELINWLQKQPILIHEHGYTLVHAGIPPHWSLTTALRRAAEVEAVLRSNQANNFFSNMYGNQPSRWRSEQQEQDQLRVITNYLTRMRFCDTDGNMELDCKLEPERGPPGYLPWYAHKNRKTAKEKIIFGHWASLNGRNCGEKLFPLDTGCVWGKQLRLLNLSTGNYTHCDCSGN